MDVDPQAINAAIEFALSKFAAVLETQFGVSLARRKGAADRVAKLSVANTEIELAPLRVQAEYAAEEERLLQKRRLKKLEAKLDAEDAPYVAPEVTIEWPVPELANANSPHKPFEHVEQKRLRNLKQVSQKTASRLSALLPHETVSKEIGDPDWFARLFDYAKDVSNEEMQELWAKILAGEIVQPGRFSLRSLDVLRNLTSEEARTFATIGRMFCAVDSDIPGGTLLFPEATLKRFDWPFEKLLLLEDAGLMKMVPLALEMGPDKSAAVSFHGLDGFIDKIEEGVVSLIDGYALTTAGAQLSRLIVGDANLDYIAFLQAQLRPRGYNLRIRVNDALIDAPMEQLGRMD